MPRSVLSLISPILLGASRTLPLLVPLAIGLGAVSGMFVDLSQSKPLILPLVVLLIYPSMIGINPCILFGLSEMRLVVSSVLMNFSLVPIAAYAIGSTLLQERPEVFAGLALTSLLPTSSMTITYTLLAGGNVHGALKTTIISLILGSTLSPLLLYLMIGRYLPFDLALTVRTLAFVIFLPMAAGMLTFELFKRFSSAEEFEKSVRPCLPGVSAICSVTIIFLSIGMESRRVFSDPQLLTTCLAAQLVFYLLVYALTIVVSRKLRLGDYDGFALLYSTVLRNVGISIGMATTMFGSQAAFMVSLALLIQPVAAAWFMRLNRKWPLLSACSFTLLSAGGPVSRRNGSGDSRR